MIKHTLIYMVAYALPGVLGFLSFGVYTRVLSPAEYAVYSVGASVSFLIGNVCFGWIRFSVGRFQAATPTANFMPFALMCLLVIALIMAPVVLIGAITMTTVTVLVTCAVVSMTIAQALFDTTQEIRRARHQSVAFTRAAVLRSILGIGLSVSAAAYFHKGTASLFGIATGFLVVGSMYVVTNRRLLYASDIEPAMINRFVAYGMPLALSGLVFSGNATLARVLVTNMLGATAGGQYGAGLDVTGQLMNMIAGSVCSIMGPAAILAYGKRGREGACDELAKGVELFLAILAPTVIGLALVAGPFAAVVSGQQFEGALGDLLPLLVLSRGLNVFAQFYLHLGFQIIEKPLRQVVCGATTLIVNLVLTVVLTKQYGLEGAAVAIFIADICGVAISFVLLHPVFPMPFPPRKVAPVLIATCVMAVACRIEQVLYAGPVHQQLIATIGVGILAYGLTALLLDICHARTTIASRGYRSLVKLIR